MQGTSTAPQPKTIPPGRPRVAVAAAETAPPRAASTISDGPPAPPALHERVGPEATTTRTEGAKSLDKPAPDAVLAAQVAFLHHAMPGMNLATAAVCLSSGLWWSHSGLGDALAPWLILGGASVLLRLYLQFGERQVLTAGLATGQARRFLVLTVIAALAAGLMWGWGWISVVPRATPEMREVFLMIQVGMLLWSLFALRPYLPALLVFVAASLVPALAWATGLYGGGAGLPGTTLSLLILGLTVVGFSVRFAQEFRATLLLQERVQGLLDEVTAKRDEAIRATLAKSRFLASVSHDLRQPMQQANQAFFQQLGDSIKALMQNWQSADRSTHEASQAIYNV